MTAFANPWERDSFNVTQQMRFVRQHGMALANAYARDAGTTVGGLKPKAEPKREQRTVILNKTIQVGGDTQGGRGYSGDGPPTG